MAAQRERSRVHITGDERFRVLSYVTFDEFHNNGVVMGSSTPHRIALVPGYIDEDDNYQTTDLSSYSRELIDIATLLWTRQTHIDWETELRR